MTTVERYISRPIEVEAIQVKQFGDFNRAVRWIRENGGDAVFSPAIVEGASDCIILAVDGVYVDVTAGMFVVRDPDGQFRVLREGSFRQQFERAFDRVAAEQGGSGTYVPRGGQATSGGLRPGTALRIPG